MFGCADPAGHHLGNLQCSLIHSAIYLPGALHLLSKLRLPVNGGDGEIPECRSYWADLQGPE